MTDSQELYTATSCYSELSIISTPGCAVVGWLRQSP